MASKCACSFLILGLCAGVGVSLFTSGDRQSHSGGSGGILQHFLKNLRSPQSTNSRPKREMGSCYISDGCLREGAAVHHCNNGGTCWFDKEWCMHWCECVDGFAGRTCETNGSDGDVIGDVTQISTSHRSVQHSAQHYDLISGSGNDVVIHPENDLIRLIYHKRDVIEHESDVTNPTPTLWYDDTNTYSGDYRYYNLDQDQYSESQTPCKVIPRNQSSKACPKDFPCYHGQCKTGSPVMLGGVLRKTGKCHCDKGWRGYDCNICDPKDPWPEQDYIRFPSVTCDVVHRLSNGCERLNGTTTGSGFPSGTGSTFPCRNGVCSRSGNRTVCVCDASWVGELCDTCCDRQCGNGTCEIRQGAPNCACDWGYTGPHCQLKSPTTASTTGHWLVAVAATGLVILSLLAVMGLLHYMWRRRVPIVMSMLQRVGLHSFNYKYDAFVSYRSTPDDEEFVLRYLLPQLERQMNFKLCLHCRDFIPGAAIADNIISAVHSSHRTILVLSPSYVQSEWTRFEYQVAQHQMLKLRHRILPIIFRDLRDVTDLDENLKVILSSVTYLPWPGTEDAGKEDKFWRTLRRAMANRPPARTADCCSHCCSPESGVQLV